MTAHAKSPQRMLMGPWGHAVNTVQQLGEVDFGPDALIDLDGYRETGRTKMRSLELVLFEKDLE